MSDADFIRWDDPTEADPDAAEINDEEIDPREGEDEADEERDAKNVGRITPRVREIRKIARESLLPAGYRRRFRAAVELDEIRKPIEKLGLTKLFEECCRNGTKYWLDPVGEMKPLFETLENFNGPNKSVRPVIYLLLQLARARISPAAFVRYVVRPRMAFDRDWRKWRERNFWALESIANFLIEIKGKPPFHRATLGPTRARTELVLVKYVGKPLSRFPAVVLDDEELREAYSDAWAALVLENPLFLTFLRSNVFPFLYRLSGKIDLIQLIAILHGAAEIEGDFAASFPPGAPEPDIFQGGLYKEFETGMMARQEKGLTVYDLVREVKAYLAIVGTLVRTNSGIYLAEYYAAILRRLMDPVAAENIARLVAAVRDTGGVYAYRWHGRVVAGLSHEAQLKFIAEVTGNDGLHPQYPYPIPARIFPDVEEDREREAASASAGTLGLPAPEAGARFPFRMIRDKVIERKPGIRGVLRAFENEITTGKDRLWRHDRIRAFDRVGDSLHEVMLRSVMPGIGRAGGSPGLVAPNLVELLSRYGAVSGQAGLPVAHEFTMVRDEREIGEPRVEKRVREKYDPLVVAAVWKAVEGATGRRDDFIAILNERARTLDQTATSADPAVAEPAKRRRAELEQIFGAWPDFTEFEKTVVASCIAARTGKPGEPIGENAIRRVFARYVDHDAVAARWKYLSIDVVPDVITIEQLDFFVNTIDAVVDRMLDEFRRVACSSECLEIATRYSLMPRAQFSVEALESAVMRVFRYSSVVSELSRRRELVESAGGPGSPEVVSYRLSASNTFLDAYYGHMGAGRLAAFPDAVLRAGFYTIRFTDLDSARIFGSAVLVYNPQDAASLGVKGFFTVFGINPLRSTVRGWSRRRLLFFYLQIRRLLEDVAKRSGKPIVIPGASTPIIVSAAEMFSAVVLGYERKHAPRETPDAVGFHPMYDPKALAPGIVIIDPKRPETFRAEADLSRIPGISPQRVSRR